MAAARWPASKSLSTAVPPGGRRTARRRGATNGRKALSAGRSPPTCATAHRSRRAGASLAVSVVPSRCLAPHLERVDCPRGARRRRPSPLELGLKFRSYADGFRGVRFIAGIGNSGTHVGNLWTTTGRCSHARPSALKRRRAGSRCFDELRSRRTDLMSYHTNVGHAASAGYLRRSPTPRRSMPCRAVPPAATASMGLRATDFQPTRSTYQLLRRRRLRQQPIRPLAITTAATAVDSSTAVIRGRMSRRRRTSTTRPRMFLRRR
jgi:hypothetical protein